MVSFELENQDTPPVPVELTATTILESWATYYQQRGGLKFTDERGDVIIATDGTVKNGKGGAAYSLHTTENPGSVRAVLPVDGLSSQISSYCTELFGILGVLLLLNRILQKEATQW